MFTRYFAVQQYSSSSAEEFAVCRGRRGDGVAFMTLTHPLVSVDRLPAIFFWAHCCTAVKSLQGDTRLSSAGDVRVQHVLDWSIYSSRG